MDLIRILLLSLVLQFYEVMRQDIIYFIFLFNTRIFETDTRLLKLHSL